MLKLFKVKKKIKAFTGTGYPLQSYNLTTKDPTDQYLVEVFVDGQLWKLVDSIYDMNNGEKCAMIKTSVNGGLSVFFGNNQFGRTACIRSKN